MATRNIKLFGTNLDATTEATVLFDGVQVFQGAVSVVTDSELFAWDFNNADDTIQSNHTLSIEVTAGSLTAGKCKISCGNDNISSWDGVVGDKATDGTIEIDGDYYYDTHGSDDGQAERTNCLIDGAVPDFLTTQSSDDDILPSGSLPDSPTFNGWYFPLDNGSTFTCTVRVPKLLEAYDGH